MGCDRIPVEIFYRRDVLEGKVQFLIFWREYFTEV